MKKILLASAFIIAYAIFLSLGMECLLCLLGAAMAISLDSASVTAQYPRFIPFCIIVGILALVALVAIFVINIKASDRFGFTKKLWWAQMIIAVVISVPMIKLWETLFDFLQKTF